MPWSVLIFLSRHPPFRHPRVLLYREPYQLRIVSRSDFFCEVFAFLFQRRVTVSGRVIFKMPEKTVASFLVSFLSSLSSSAAALFRSSPPPSFSPPHRRHPRLSLIWMGGSFCSMKFESRLGRKPSDDESRLFPRGNGRTKNVGQSKFKLAMLMVGAEVETENVIFVIELSLSTKMLRTH